MNYLAQKENLRQLTLALELLCSNSISFSAVLIDQNLDPKLLVKEEKDEFSKIKNTKRAFQFIAGRLAARKALEQTGYKNASSFALKKSTNGLAVWPANFWGSISHSNQFAVAISSNLSKYQGLGIDLEFYRDINNSNLANKIGISEEYNRLPYNLQLIPEKLFCLFSAKEAIYKAAYPIVKKEFGFKTVELVEVKTKTIQEITILDLDLSLKNQLSSQFQEGYIFKIKAALSDSFAITLCSIPSVS